MPPVSPFSYRIFHLHTLPSEILFELPIPLQSPLDLLVRRVVFIMYFSPTSDPHASIGT